VIEAHGYKVFDDTYNASPASVTSALHTLASMAGDRKIAVLGDMLELGDHAEAAHHYVGKVAAESCLTLLLTVGELSKSITDGARDAGFCNIHEYSTSEEAADALKSEVKPGDVVLVKGSRGMKMEKVVEALK
jgi:UDP-N-acetylmuramyl pentapeptide synthase